MNVWAFTGNLGADAESRYMPTSDAVVSFSVGVKSGFGAKATTTWARCSMFGSRGESVAPYLTKGQLVGISGELSVREWEKDGQKRTSIEVRVNDLTLLGKRDAGQQSEPPRQPAPQQRQEPARQQAPAASGFGYFEDSIPF